VCWFRCMLKIPWHRPKRKGEFLPLSLSLSRRLRCFSGKVLKYSDLCVPLARSPGNPYMLMAEASVEDFSNLGIAFMENRLEMDDGMVPAKIVSVQLKGPLGNEPSKPSERGRNEPARGSCPSRTSVSEPAPGGEGEAGGETGEERGRESHRPQEEERFESHAHGLHLASCSECLGLESSTIESVRCASAENPPSAGPERGEEGPAGAGQRRSEGGGRRAPPNVLVYLGPDGEDDGGRGNAAKFRRVQSLLTDLIDSERYVIYRLLEEHVATEPWPENSLLLVVACERPPAPRVLGLCSGFTFGGARLSARGRPEERVLGLRFTGSQGGPSLSLHALASRRVFSLDRPWASLENPRRDPVVVRLPHGDNGGEAVLCQVHLETAPDGEEIQAQEDFQTLKLSNALRYQVLREILTFLQLSCECTETPKLTPANLLISCKVQSCFVLSGFDFLFYPSSPTHLRTRFPTLSTGPSPTSPFSPRSWKELSPPNCALSFPPILFSNPLQSGFLLPIAQKLPWSRSPMIS
uniref:Uncharacterized protein n=1 Tax=Callorhinchus milii TaxID=7868 RepID=A0A4W3GK20_CALMI